MAPSLSLLCLCYWSSALVAVDGFTRSSWSVVRPPQTKIEGGFLAQRRTRHSPMVLGLADSKDSSVSILDNTVTPENKEGQDPEKINPRAQYDSIVCGGGPAGLLAAIMLTRQFGPSHRIAVVERRPQIPPSPDNQSVWSDIARFYLLGIGFRGQRALKQFGVLSDFEKASVAVQGRRDWQPGKTKVEDGRITKSNKSVTSRILARDKLVGCLYYHILNNYANSNIDFLFGYQLEPLDFGLESTAMESPVKVQISKCVNPQEDAGAAGGEDDQIVRLGGNGDSTETNEDDADPQEIASTTMAATTAETVESANKSDDEELCSVDSTSHLSETKLLIAADGSARTIANAMEEHDAQQLAKTNPLLRPFQPRPFKVKRYVEDNPRVYKSVPICLPSDWPCDLNYSARSTDSRITMEALPSDDKGNLCALLLIKPEDEFAQANVDPQKLRKFFDKEFPQFGALIDDEEMARLATKPVSKLPSFRSVGPRLNMGERTIVLGDAAHTVKPYYGLGANSAMEDVRILSDAIDEVSTSDSALTASYKDDSVIPDAVKLFSKQRSGDAQALVKMSRNLDRPMPWFFVTFLIPLILDGIFNKIAPKIFSPNMFAMFAKDLSFKQIQRKKRLDRLLQLVIIGSGLASAATAAKLLVKQVAKWTGQSQIVVLLASMAISVTSKFLLGLKKPAQPE